jgi:hypothetical protein
MSVGLTVLVMFSKEIVSLASSMFDLDESFKISQKTQSEYFSRMKELYEQRIEYLYAEAIANGKLTESQVKQLKNNREFSSKKEAADRSYYDKLRQIREEYETQSVLGQLAYQTKTAMLGGIYDLSRRQERASQLKIAEQEYLKELNLIGLDELSARKELNRLKEDENTRNNKKEKETKSAYSEDFIKASNDLHDEVMKVKQLNDEDLLKEEIFVKGRELEIKYDSDKKILEQIIKNNKTTKEKTEKAKAELIRIEEHYNRVKIDINTYYLEKTRVLRQKQDQIDYDENQARSEEQQKREKERIEKLNNLRERDYELGLYRLETQLIELNTAKIKGLKTDEDIAKKEIEIAKYKLEAVLSNSRASVEEINRAMAEYDRVLAGVSKSAIKTAEDTLAYRSQLFLRTLNFLQAELDAEYNLRQKALDREILQREKAIDRQVELAKAGKENQLAWEEQRLAKAELKRQDLERKAAKQREAIQLAEAYLNAYNAELRVTGANPSTASIKALKDVLIAKGIGKFLASFFVGTEDTGKGGGIDGKGGFLAINHPHERIMPMSNNMEIKKSANGKVLSNNQLTDIAVRFNKGLLVDIEKAGGFIDRPPISYKDIRNESEQIRLLKTIADKPVQMVNVDSFGNIIETIYEKGKKDIIVHKRKTRL